MPTQPDTQKSRDPFLDEVHALKRDAFARSGDDMKRHVERLRELERKHSGGTVQAPSMKDGRAA